MPPISLNYNIRMPTLGGRQFWGDVVNFRGWRIQQHVYSRHFRLLDPRDVRHAWGSCEQCQAELERIKTEEKLPQLTGKVAILIHGIMRSSKSFAQMQRELTDDGYIVIPFDYPSSRVTIPESARYLKQVVDSLAGVEQIDFVVHSMGGLIVRAYLKETADHPDPRITRMVMLGVPNLGAKMANIMQRSAIYQAIYGPAGQQLVEDEAGLIASLPVPAFDFAVVAGSKGDSDGYNPLIPGDDDGIVTVESACLPGACDSLLVRGVHSFLPANADVITATRRFLNTGSLHPDGSRQPVPRANDSESPSQPATATKPQ